MRQPTRQEANIVAGAVSGALATAMYLADMPIVPWLFVFLAFCALALAIEGVKK